MKIVGFFMLAILAALCVWPVSKGVGQEEHPPIIDVANHRCVYDRQTVTSEPCSPSVPPCSGTCTQVEGTVAWCSWMPTRTCTANIPTTEYPVPLFEGVCHAQGFGLGWCSCKDLHYIGDGYHDYLTCW
jgi:hypothetical protein